MLFSGFDLLRRQLGALWMLIGLCSFWKLARLQRHLASLVHFVYQLGYRSTCLNLQLLEMLHFKIWCYFFTKQDYFEVADQFHDAKSGFERELFFFDAIDGYSSDGPLKATKIGPLEATKCYVESQIQLPVSHALVSALTTAGEEDTGSTSVATFDSASSFWVCDNSATGHICKSKSMFHGPLVPSV